MIYYTVDNPTVKPIQEWDIPLHSVVYVALKPDAFPNLYLKMLNLDDGQWDMAVGEAVSPNSNGAYINRIASSGVTTSIILYSENNLVLAKMSLGESPFNRTVQAKVIGYTSTVDGVKTQTINRWSFQGSDGNTYLFDYVRLGGLTWGMYSDVGGYAQYPYYLGIIRDSEGTMLGYTTYKMSRTYLVKISGRNQTAVECDSFCDAPLVGNRNLIPTQFVLYSSSNAYSLVFPDGYSLSRTQITKVGSVEITDCPNITYTLADPVIVPITINCTDKSYCYIQF